MDWRVKALVQGTLSRLPGGMAANDLLQRTLGKRRDQGEHIDQKVRQDWLVHMTQLHRLGFDPRGKLLLEIGTGWLPVFPLCFALVGARGCHTYDLSRHLVSDAVPGTLARLQQHLGALADAAGQPLAEVQARWQQLAAASDGAALLAAAGVEYHAPQDVTRCGLADQSVDLVFSNSVLEHVPGPVIDQMMVETRRVLRQDGLVYHSVNCGDHYAYFDKSLSPVNYLRYTERQWRWLNNDFMYQNRLRPADFLQSAQRAGLHLTMEAWRPRPELLQALDRQAVAPQFRHLPPEQLCCTSIDFAAMPRPPAA